MFLGSFDLYKLRIYNNDFGKKCSIKIAYIYTHTRRNKVGISRVNNDYRIQYIVLHVRTKLAAKKKREYIYYI